MKKLFNGFLILVVVLGLLAGAGYGILRLVNYNQWKNGILEAHMPGKVFNYMGDEVIVVDYEEQKTEWQVRPVDREAVYRLEWEDIERNHEENERIAKAALPEPEPDPEPVVEAEPERIRKEIGDDPFNVVAAFNKGDVVKYKASGNQATIEGKYKDENDQVCYDLAVIIKGKPTYAEFVPEYQLEKVEK